MPLSVTQYKIFLASPGELSDERMLIEDVIRELNITFGEPKGINLQLLKWETHSAPAVSKSDVQGIINNDIGNDYDLFIGLLWKRFGTPTDKADSGTEEEFLNAYERFKADPNSLQILFYFKNAPITPDVDLEQLGKVQKFKSEIIEKKNLLFGEYLDAEQLCSFLRVHIPKRIIELNENQNIKRLVLKEEKEKTLIPEIIYKEEYGLIDYQDQYDDSIHESNLALSRIVESINWIGNQFSEKTEELLNLTSNKKHPPSRKSVRNIMIRMSKSMRTFGSIIETESPIFSANFELAINSMQKILELYRDDFNIGKEDVQATRNNLADLISAMDSSLPSTEEFIQSIDDLPRMSKEINIAKLSLKGKLGNLVQNMKISISISVNLIDSFDDFLDSL